MLAISSAKKADCLDSPSLMQHAKNVEYKAIRPSYCPYTLIDQFYSHVMAIVFFFQTLLPRGKEVRLITRRYIAIITHSGAGHHDKTVRYSKHKSRHYCIDINVRVFSFLGIISDMFECNHFLRIQ